MTDRAQKLGEGLLKLTEGVDGATWPEYVAAGILAHPQQAADLLVEAGVLMRTVHGGGGKDAWVSYQVVQPQVHEWRLTGFSSDLRQVALRCACTEGGDPVWVPNRLPIEVPECP